MKKSMCHTEKKPVKLQLLHTSPLLTLICCICASHECHQNSSIQLFLDHLLRPLHLVKKNDFMLFPCYFTIMSGSVQKKCLRVPFLRFNLKNNHVKKKWREKNICKKNGVVNELRTEK